MDENKQAILLLSAHFSAPAKGASTPLTALEYGRFAVWMRDSGYQPKDLFHRVDDLLGQWVDPKGKVTGERVRYLLGRGLAMGLAIEKWHSAGIWIIARSDNEYPQRLKQRLGQAAPAVLFGVGSKALLNAGGLAVVGSRNIGDTETAFTRVVGSQAAAEGLNVVSGGARGVDETSMLAALESAGTALGIVANDLFKSALSGKWRKYLKSEQLVLVSPFYPEARFQVGNAMGRNKYIYCLAEAALVVRSEQGSGGTWAGATENLKNAWVPLFVASPSDAEGNAVLLKMGAEALQAERTGVSGADVSRVDVSCADVSGTGVSASSDWLRAQLAGTSVKKVAVR